jgi:hypothetical protein
MLKRLRPRSAYDVIAVVALCLAIGTGGAYAANTIGSSDIIDESIQSVDIKDGQVNTADVHPNSIGTSRLLNGGVASVDLKDGGVATPDLAANAVTGAKVADDSLTGADIQESSLGKVPEADTLDGFDWTSFEQAGATAANSDLLDGRDSSEFLGTSDTAADSALLNGRDAKSFARLGGVVNGDGSIVQGTGFTVGRLNEGEYQVSFPSGTLSNALCPPVVSAIVFSGLVRLPQLSSRTCSGLGAGSFTLKTLDSAGVPHDTPFLFIAM